MMMLDLRLVKPSLYWLVVDVETTETAIDADDCDDVVDTRVD